MHDLKILNGNFVHWLKVEVFICVCVDCQRAEIFTKSVKIYLPYIPVETEKMCHEKNTLRIDFSWGKYYADMKERKCKVIRNYQAT